MAEIFNEQRVLGIVTVPDGTTMYNGQRVIGIRDAGGALFVDNLRTVRVQEIDDGGVIYNDQPVLGAVLIEDDRAIYNDQLVIPANGAAPPQVTVDFTAAQVNGMIAGYDPTTTAGRLILAQGSTSQTTFQSVGFLYVTGSKAVLNAKNPSIPAPTAGVVKVSIDDGAFVNAAVENNIFVLFSGLPDVPHKVVWQIASGQSGAWYIPTTGNVLTVTGAAPAVEIPQSFVYPGDTDTNHSTADVLITNTKGANFVPGKVRVHASARPGMVNNIVVNADAEYIYVATTANAIYVSVNGAASTRYVGLSATSPNCIRIPGAVGAATYYIWSAATGLQGSGVPPLHAVGAKFRTGGWNPVSLGFLDQFGDSITQGTAADYQGGTDTYILGHMMGRVAASHGIAGWTTLDLVTNIDGVLTGKIRAIGSNDVAILKIGRNDTGNFDTTVQSNYTSIINKIMTAGYGKCLCVGVMSESNGFAAVNTIIQGLVANYNAGANPGAGNVKFIDVSTWNGLVYGSGDGTHPVEGPTGYGKLAATFEYPAYTAALA